MSLPFDSHKLRFFVPLNDISPSNFDELVKNINVEKLSSNTTVFKTGDENEFTYYLLNGEIEITDANGNTSQLSSKSQQCRFPLEHKFPREKTIKTVTDIHYFKINNDLLDVLLTWDQNKNYIVNEISDSSSKDDTDWMTQLLQLEIFHKVPAANIHEILKRVEPISVNKDDVIIKQGDKGDYYYVIKSGACRVLRNSAETGNKQLQIANLTEGSSFGDDALTSDSPRNASVIMETDGVLLRLAKDDFVQLLKEPVLNTVNFEEAENMVEQGAVWLDVRLISEHENNNVLNGLNIPLYLLRLNLKKLSADTKYIVYCDTGSRSASATFLLTEKGFNAYLLEGGIATIKHKEDIAS